VRRAADGMTDEAQVADAALALEALGEYSQRLIDAPDAWVARADARAILYECLEKLRPREAQVITMRFGLDGNGAHTLAQIGKVFGVSPACIRQIEARGLRALRHPSNTDQLWLYKVKYECCYVLVSDDPLAQRHCRGCWYATRAKAEAYVQRLRVERPTAFKQAVFHVYAYSSELAASMARVDDEIGCAGRIE